MDIITYALLNKKIKEIVPPEPEEIIISGYYNKSNGQFYENYNPTTEQFSGLIEPKSNAMFIDLIDVVEYYYVNNEYIPTAKGFKSDYAVKNAAVAGGRLVLQKDKYLTSTTTDPSEPDEPSLQFYICTNAADTPVGVTLDLEDAPVIGTLEPEDAQQQLIYLVKPDKTSDSFDEYVVLEHPVGTFIWEKLGSSSIDVATSFVALVNTTSSADIIEAIEARKTILVTHGINYPLYTVTTASKSGTTAYLIVHEFSGTNPRKRLSSTRYNITDTAWSIEKVISAALDDAPFVATINSTTAVDINAAISNKRAIVVATGDNQPIYTAIRAEKLENGHSYLLAVKITEDEDRWNRERPTFYAWTVYGNVWTAYDPLAAVIDADLANLVDALPRTGLAQTRYLLKVLDAQNNIDHLEEYIYHNNQWIIVSENKIYSAYTDTTAVADINTAIQAKKVIFINDKLVVHNSRITENYTDLFVISSFSDLNDNFTPIFLRYRVSSSGWVETKLELGVYIATVGVTTEAELKEAIAAKREILVTNSGENQPYHLVTYVEDKGENGVYLVCDKAIVDTDRWNRTRPALQAYTITANTWTGSGWISSVIDADLTNVVTSLPSTGVANTRYLLKVNDTSTEGYHLDEYIYRDNKWICISKDKPAPFLATIRVTSQQQIMAAVNSGSPIYVYSDITGGLWPAISAVANSFTATVRYLTVGSSSGNYTVDIVSNSIVGTTWTPTEIHLALKSDLDNYVPKLTTPISASTTNYIRAFQMNADGLITGTSGAYTKSDTISSSSTVNQLASAKSVRDYVATPTKVALTYNTSYIAANYSTCYKVAEKIYMCNLAFQTSAEVPANTWLIRFPENILSSGAEGYCVMHCTDRTNIPATLLLQIGGSTNFNQLFVKTNPFPANKYYFGNMILIKTA